MTLPASPLFDDIRSLIDAARARAQAAVNAELTLLYWHIGQRINEDVLQGERADYGKAVINQLAKQLRAEYGRGYTAKNLRHMMKFAEVFPDAQIVSAVSRQLSWTHLRSLIYIEDDLKREFYLSMSQIERWSTRVLQERMGSMLYERTALSKKPEVLIQEELNALQAEGKLTPDLVFRDPYVLDFLGLKDRYLERDLEDAILRELETFLLELGAGFSFIARQYRISVDNDDYYVDLLFYHRGLRRLVAIDLKLDSFKPAYKGQMELYLRWLDRYERQEGEERPIGLILCAGKKQETVELLALDDAGIRVAEYLTELPARALLEARLHEAITAARARMSRRLSE